VTDKLFSKGTVTTFGLSVFLRLEPAYTISPSLDCVDLLHFRANLSFSNAQAMTLKNKKKPKTTKSGTVEKIIKSPFPQEPEKAEIAIEGADQLYREIRIENTLEDENGNQVKLKKGAPVEVTVEADTKDTIPKTAKTSA
jgi:hypothetical protein